MLLRYRIKGELGQYQILAGCMGFVLFTHFFVWDSSCGLIPYKKMSKKDSSHTTCWYLVLYQFSFYPVSKLHLQHFKINFYHSIKRYFLSSKNAQGYVNKTKWLPLKFWLKVEKVLKFIVQFPLSPYLNAINYILSASS